MLLQPGTGPGQRCSGHPAAITPLCPVARGTRRCGPWEVESVARSCQVHTARRASSWGVKSPGKPSGAALCPRMLLGRAPSAEGTVLTWAFQCPARCQGQDSSKQTKRPDWPCWRGGRWQKAQTDRQTRPRGCLVLQCFTGPFLCGSYKRDRLGLSGSSRGSGSRRGGQTDGRGLRIPQAVSVGCAAEERTEVGSVHGQHRLQAADPAGQTDG